MVVILQGWVIPLTPAVWPYGQSRHGRLVQFSHKAPGQGAKWGQRSSPQSPHQPDTLVPGCSLPEEGGPSPNWRLSALSQPTLEGSGLAGNPSGVCQQPPLGPGDALGPGHSLRAT